MSTDEQLDQLPLMEHQRNDISWIHQQGRGLLGNEPGLGKSRSAIEAFDGGNNLIIAPNLVLEGGTWVDEIERWSEHPDGWRTAPYSRLNDRKKTGRGSGTTPVKRLREEYRGDYDALVVDEAHYAKGRKTTWTWAVEEIAKRSDSVLLMTGTPMPNWAHELFTLLRMINPEEAHPGAKYGSFWRWAGQWFDTSPTIFSQGMPAVGEMLACTDACMTRPSWDPCQHYHDFVAENLGPKFRRVLRDDCLDLPPLTTQVINVPMDASQGKIYRQMKKKFMAEHNGHEVLAWSQGAANVAIDKITTSHALLGFDDIARGGKLDRLRYDLASRSRPTLVLAHYRDSVEACAAVARDLGLRVSVIHGGISSKARTEAVARFKAGGTDVIVGSLETLAEGLTLTQADMAIFVEMSYKPSRNEQARYRIHRMGQERACTILEYVTPNTVDARKRKLLETKTDRQMRVLSAAQFRELL